MSYITDYTITISNIVDEFYTSRYPSSSTRPMLIYPGDIFWGYMMFSCKCTKSPNGGFWYRVWTVLNNGWQTAVSNPEWLNSGSSLIEGIWRNTHDFPGVYSPKTMADGVAFDGFHQIEFGYNNQYWGDQIMLASDRDSEVFRNKLFSYRFSVAAPSIDPV